MIILEILGQIVFWMVMLVGILIIPVGIPGTFLIAGNTLVYGWLTGFNEITWTLIGMLFLLCILLEVFEFFIGAASAVKFGASRQGMFGAIVGGFVGAVWATPLFPFIGTIIGAFVGAFAGASLFEYLGTKDLQKSLRVGFGAFLGSLGGKLTKMATAIAMVVFVGFQMF